MWFYAAILAPAAETPRLAAGRTLASWRDDSETFVFTHTIDQAGALSSVARIISSAPNPRVLPPEVAQCSVSLGPAAGDLAAANAFGDFELPTELLHAVPGRQRQYLAGRLCALLALQDLAPTHPARNIGRQASGAPVWPAGFTGSITHTEDFASAAIGRSCDVSSVGIDTERVIAEEKASIVRDVAWPCEVAEARQAGCTRLEAITLVFSAKESIFKCLWSRVGRRFAFHDVRIVAVDADRGTFSARLTKTLSGEFRASRVLSGQFDISAHYVHTGMVLPPIPE
jgi:enterobactin synthetase component D